MKYIDCFIPWQSDEQVRGTLDCLEAEPQVQSVNFLREEGPGNTKTIRFIAETATAPYTLLYNKYDTLQLGYHALTRLLTIAEDSQALMMYSDHYKATSPPCPPSLALPNRSAPNRRLPEGGSARRRRGLKRKDYEKDSIRYPQQQSAEYPKGARHSLARRSTPPFGGR